MDIRYDSRKKINGQCGKGWKEGPNGKCIRSRNGDFSGALWNVGKEGILKASLKDTVFGAHGASEYRRRRSVGQSRGQAALAGAGYKAKYALKSAIFTPVGARVYQGSRDIGQSRKQAAKKGFATGAALVAGIAIKNKLGQKKTEAKANAEKMKGVVDVKATRVDSSDDAKCDRKAGWVRGPGGKCVRKKKSSVKRDLATLGLIGAAGLVGADLLSKKVIKTVSGERAKPGHNTVYVMPGNAIARARRQAGAIDVTATRVDAEYALGYLAGKGVEYHGDNPVGYLHGYLQFREDAARPKCDPEKGWVRGPGGKCVRKKKGDSNKPGVNLGHLGVVGGTIGALAGAALLRKQQQKKQEEMMNSMRSNILKNIGKREQKRSSGASYSVWGQS